MGSPYSKEVQMSAPYSMWGSLGVWGESHMDQRGIGTEDATDGLYCKPGNASGLSRKLIHIASPYTGPSYRSQPIYLPSAPFQHNQSL